MLVGGGVFIIEHKSHSLPVGSGWWDDAAPAGWAGRA
eukprot:COSAG01_NODE_65837_length_272_cov_0.595376_1_plen_36_part_01